MEQRLIGKIMYQNLNVNNHISKPGLIREYRKLLNTNKIAHYRRHHRKHGEYLGAHQRLIKWTRKDI